MYGTTTRAVTRERLDVPNSDNRCACGRKVDGYDAQRDEAVCQQCAQLRADGGDLEDIYVEEGDSR